jgi:hypothetical protein
MKNLALIAALAVLAMGSTVASAKDSSSSKLAVKALTGVPAAELPAIAAKVVVSTPSQERAAVVNAVMHKVARTRPVALHHVVTAIAKADPSMAAVAAAAASKANPESVHAVTAAACTAAPDKAAEVLAVLSRGTVGGRETLAQTVATVNPSFSAQALSAQAATFEITADADVITGGTVIDELPVLPPGALGQAMDGTFILSAPRPVGPGRPGFDPDRYAAAGS